MLLPNPNTTARLRPDHPPVLLVIVDTEEEFAWDQPFNRGSVGTTSISGQPHIHERVYDRLGIVPTYMVDWPVATTPQSIATLHALMKAGQCEIGTHLHPWVSPPYEETVSPFNSYAGNLPRQLEYDKLRLLTSAITDAFQRSPVAFKAGRYGVGPNTAEIIASLGYQIDASVVPYTAFTIDGGPDFSAFDEHPYWFTAGGGDLLELPVTAGFCGWLRNSGPAIYPITQQSWAKTVKLGGILARTRGLERIRLSPEGATAGDMMRLTQALMRTGCQVYSLTYHSPSLVPGHTPYVRSAADLAQFVESIRSYCTWFQQELGGVFLSLSQVRAAMAKQVG
ncbi:polysaccharide deacetylase family protein [Pseudoduganella namucuonensis]|uniref:Glycosyltransferase n=1 Tax=Pseudoduganella namucuonensis TaxID=1035707 RepID=A0A1I7GEN5_9BURK|nr:polysaccharide deacetylase family protein [Pseudoduganella namucuonensis]SFU46726.1 hypothetical protein SAMN05216552_1003263 [Pseudoduganella namucuonensis]